MKKLIFISLLLLVTSNGWTDKSVTELANQLILDDTYLNQAEKEIAADLNYLVLEEISIKCFTLFAASIVLDTRDKSNWSNPELALYDIARQMSFHFMTFFTLFGTDLTQINSNNKEQNVNDIILGFLSKLDADKSRELQIDEFGNTYYAPPKGERETCLTIYEEIYNDDWQKRIDSYDLYDNLIDGWEKQYPKIKIPPYSMSQENLEAPKACCKICKKGKACGDSCINRKFTCHKPPGCACNG